MQTPSLSKLCVKYFLLSWETAFIYLIICHKVGLRGPFYLGEEGERLVFRIGLAASISDPFGLEKAPALGQEKKWKGQKAQEKSFIICRLFHLL